MRREEVQEVWVVGWLGRGHGRGEGTGMHGWRVEGGGWGARRACSLSICPLLARTTRKSSSACVLETAYRLTVATTQEQFIKSVNKDRLSLTSGPANLRRARTRALVLSWSMAPRVGECACRAVQP